ncbi:lymphocyte antigen 6G-like isoform X2 [Labrus mixtus]|uniref:lymphocyte antigen 6G-like isoform X2 n=1 Tax=Labrus mixtus TaxID=508554 RepID=UPI0029C095F0|nr:lymphocyte antigen 6G-like isoform X2 [Labrus mixtus]
MKLYGALILFVTLSTACGLRCYTCTAADPRSCTDTKSCAVIFDRCFSLPIGTDVINKGCQNNLLCVGAMSCCEGDLCNSAVPTGSSVLLLLVSSALITLFL